VLSHDPLAVAITILHIEWMTQRHYVESIREDRQLDAQFKNLLLHHWIEEAQHAKLDTLMIDALAEGRSEASILRAVEEYLQIIGQLDDGLAQQVEFDMKALMRATRRTLTEDEKNEFRSVQLRANRWTYLGSGMMHENVLATLARLSPAARTRVERAAPAFG
jgi:hypothetical protein